MSAVYEHNDASGNVTALAVKHIAYLHMSSGSSNITAHLGGATDTQLKCKDNDAALAVYNRLKELMERKS